VLGHERVTLQLLASLFSAGLFGLVGFIACGRLGVRRTVVLMLPLAGSMYLFYPAVWLLPDNAAWLGVVAVVWMSLRWRVGVLSLIGVMAVTGALVYARQIHLWVLAPVWTAAYLGPREGGSRGNVERSELLAWDMPSLFKGEQLLGLGRVGVAMAAAALPCGILAVLVREWGGLTPPFFQGAYHGGNTAAPAFVLSLFALFAPWYAVFVWGRLARTMSGGRVGMVIGRGAGAGVRAGVAVDLQHGGGALLGAVEHHAVAAGDRGSIGADPDAEPGGRGVRDGDAWDAGAAGQVGDGGDAGGVHRGAEREP
jgi:hypothetical protein